MFSSPVAKEPDSLHGPRLRPLRPSVPPARQAAVGAEENPDPEEEPGPGVRPDVSQTPATHRDTGAGDIGGMDGMV